MHRDQLHIEKPCHADWDAMSGDQRERFCGSCTKHVHDLSAMTERQAARLVRSNGDLCVRYAADADGRVLHARSRLPRLVAMGAALLGATPALAATAPAVTGEEPGLVERVMTRVQQAVDAALAPAPVVSQGQVEVLMGDIAPPPPPPPPMMGKIAPPPTLRIPAPVVPAPVVIPTPAPGETVIPEVEEALRRQR